MEGIIVKLIMKYDSQNDRKGDVDNDPEKWPNELSLHDMNACPQLDTFHIGSYFGPLVPNFRTWNKIIIHTLCFRKY